MTRNSNKRPEKYYKEEAKFIESQLQNQFQNTVNIILQVIGVKVLNNNSNHIITTNNILQKWLHNKILS